MRQGQGHDDPGLTGASGPTGPVQVVLRTGGRIDLEHQPDLVDVDAAGGDVGGDEDGQPAVLEGGQDPRPGALGQAAVQRAGEHARCAQLLGHSIRAPLGADEDDRPAVAAGDLRGQQGLVGGSDEEHVVFHRADARLARIDLVGDRVAQVAAHEFVDRPVEGGGEQHPLPARRDGVEDLGDGRHEAEVGHVVGLVQHDDLDPGEVGRALIHQVDQPARGGHDDVDAALERLELRAVRHPAGDQSEAQALGAGQRGQHVGDLERELTGRHQDEARGRSPTGRPSRPGS